MQVPRAADGKVPADIAHDLVSGIGRAIREHVALSISPVTSLIDATPMSQVLVPLAAASSFVEQTQDVTERFPDTVADFGAFFAFAIDNINKAVDGLAVSRERPPRLFRPVLVFVTAGVHGGDAVERQARFSDPTWRRRPHFVTLLVGEPFRKHEPVENRQGMGRNRGGR